METKSVIILFLAGLTLCYGSDFEDVAEGTSNRLLDGRLAAEGQFPYVVSIQLLGSDHENNTRGHRCGGALFTASHVVTVATCFYEVNINNTAELQTASQYRVFGGANLLTNDTSPDRIRNVSNFIIHPDYTGPPAFVNNVAVIFLSAAFPANVATPIALPNANFNPVDFTTCTIAGWGGNNPLEEVSDQLRFANKYVYNQNLCMTLFNTVPGIKNILPSMVCAVSLDLLSSNCRGDDGNPLVCAGTLTGVLSVSDGCTRSTLPEVYTRVSNYTAWIRNVSGSHTIYAPGIFVLTALFSIIHVMFGS